MIYPAWAFPWWGFETCFDASCQFFPACFELPTSTLVSLCIWRIERTNVKYKNITKCKITEQNHKAENYKNKTKKHANVWCHANLCHKGLMLNWSAKNSAYRSNCFSLILKLWLLRGVSVALASVTHASRRAHRLSSPAFSSDLLVSVFVFACVLECICIWRHCICIY